MPGGKDRHGAGLGSSSSSHLVSATGWAWRLAGGAKPHGGGALGVIERVLWVKGWNAVSRVQAGFRRIFLTKFQMNLKFS